ncbi:MAG: RNA methyltransferase [Ignavibacteriaceae bacterium]|jgi:TrmH family RNA methyltransferase
MLTKNELKYFSSLNQKKFRNKENKFIVEGSKIVYEGLNSSFSCELVLVTNKYFEENQDYIKRVTKKNLRLEVLKNQEFSKLTDTVNPQGIAAVFDKPAENGKANDNLGSKLIICLDNISDPGNLGTIIRNSDWFGIKEILFINNCADIYNPKSIRACMGSIFHLKTFEDSKIERLIKLKKSGYKILCSDLTGNNIYSYTPTGKSIIVFSNEATGPSREILSLADDKITIPKTGNAESLNVASASAVILALFTTAIS